MADGKLVVGVRCRAYYSASGSEGATWLDLETIGDVQLALPRESSKVPERGSDFLKTLVGQVDAEVTIRLNRRPGNTAYDAFRAAHIAGGDIGCCFASGDRTVAGNEEFMADFKITGWQVNEPASGGEASTVDVTLSPSAESSFEPVYQAIASGGGGGGGG